MSHYFLCSQNKDSINNRFIQLLVSDFVAAEFPKTPSPKPARIHSPDPFLRAGKFSRGFAKSFPPEKQIFVLPSPYWRPTYCPNTWRAEPQRKMSFPFSRKISPSPNQKSKRHFSLGLLAYSPVRGAFSERTIQFRATTRFARATSFVLEVGASLVQ